jgi:aspartate/methionine/tyrosine aminotransferase
MPIPARIAKLLIRTGIVGLHPGVRKLMGDGIPFLKYYSSRVLEAPNEELTRSREAMDVGADLIDLCLGAPPMLPELRDRLGVLKHDSRGYPPVAGLPELLTAFADKLHHDNDLAADPGRELLVVNGVSQGLGLFLDTFLDPGESIVVFDPGYFMHRLAAQHRRLKLRTIPTTLESGWLRFDEKLLAKSLKGSKALLLNSPCNPTGGVIEPCDLERIAYWARRRDALIFSDEVYEHFHFVPKPANIATLPDSRKRTVSAFSFSKTYGMAGHRVGVLHADYWLLRPMIVSMLASAPFVSASSQRLAAAALSLPAEAVVRRRDEFRRRRDRAFNILQCHGRTISPPGGAFFCWISIADLGVAAHEVCVQLRQRVGVAAMPGESLAANGAKFIRLSFAESPGVWEEGFTRIARALAEWTAKPSKRAA